MDYGGNPSYIDSSGNEISCGYAPIVAIVADSADWQAPGWFGGTLIIDEYMNSPLMCQTMCVDNADCDYFSYEWELTAGGMYHECYLKTEYSNEGGSHGDVSAGVDAAACMADPYVPWSSEDAQWHGESSEGVPCAPSYVPTLVVQLRAQGGDHSSVPFLRDLLEDSHHQLPHLGTVILQTRGCSGDRTGST